MYVIYALSQHTSVHHNPHYTDMTPKKSGRTPSPANLRLTRFTAAAIALISSGVFAQSSDADFRALLKERKSTEAEALARDRITRQPQDDMALWYLTRITAGDAQKPDELIPKVEQCLKALPQSAKCQNALGTLYGAAALSSGLVDGIKYASRIKERFEKAVELDPPFFDARRDLNQFYLQAPGLAGGSARKAYANADSYAKINANLGALLRAEVHIYEKEFDQAENILNNVKADTDERVTEALPQIWTSLDSSIIAAEQPGKAMKLFERLSAVDMNNATFFFGLGRAQLEAKLVEAAIISFERALKLDSKITLHYRLGIAYKTKGDKPKAIAAFKQFLTYQTQGKAVDDAKKRLETLASAG